MNSLLNVKNVVQELMKNKNSMPEYEENRPVEKKQSIFGECGWSDDDGFQDIDLEMENEKR